MKTKLRDVLKVFFSPLFILFLCLLILQDQAFAFKCPLWIDKLLRRNLPFESSALRNFQSQYNSYKKNMRNHSIGRNPEDMNFLLPDQTSLLQGMIKDLNSWKKRLKRFEQGHVLNSTPKGITSFIDPLIHQMEEVMEREIFPFDEVFKLVKKHSVAMEIYRKGFESKDLQVVFSHHEVNFENALELMEKSPWIQAPLSRKWRDENLRSQDIHPFVYFTFEKLSVTDRIYIFSKNAIAIELTSTPRSPDGQPSGILSWISHEIRHGRDKIEHFLRIRSHLKEILGVKKDMVPFQKWTLQIQRVLKKIKRVKDEKEQEGILLLLFTIIHEISLPPHFAFWRDYFYIQEKTLKHERDYRTIFRENDPNFKTGKGYFFSLFHLDHFRRFLQSGVYGESASRRFSSDTPDDWVRRLLRLKKMMWPGPFKMSS